MYDRFDTPDTIVGIGGTGKEVVTKLMQEDWILKGTIESHTADVQGTLSDQFSAFAIDTDNNPSTLREDREIENKIREKIQKTLKGRDTDIRPEYTYINLVDQTDQRYTDPDALTNPTTVSEIMTDQGLSCWWLRRGRMMNDISNYSDGVVRKRGLSKALFFASELDAEPLNPVIQRANQGNHVAMIAGLGGGTGSGMCLDIARRIYRDSDARVTLFAVLPKQGSGETDIGANTHAVLSELEHCAIDEEIDNPFHNIVLLPLDPAKSDDYDEVDKALIHTIVSYYNSTNDRDLQNQTRNFDESEGGVGPDRFAPFTMAVPQILEYPTADIEESRENVQKWISDKNRSLDHEEKLYDELEAYFQTHYKDIFEKMQFSGYGENAALRLKDEDVWSLYDNRMEPLKNLLGQPALQHLGYRSAQATISTIEEIEDSIAETVEEPDRVDIYRDLFSRAPARFDNSPSNAQPDDGKMESFDQEFSELMVREMRVIGRRRDLMRAIDVVDDVVVNDGLRSTINTAKQGIIGTDVDAHIATLETEVNRLDSMVYEYEELERAAEDIVNQEIDVWRREAREDLSKLLELRANQRQVTKLLDGLEDAIKTDLVSLEEDRLPSEVSDGQPDYSEFEELDDLLQSLNVEPVSVADISRSVGGLRDARRYWLHEENGSRFRDLKEAIMGTKENPFTGYQNAREKIDSTLFDCSEWNELDFECHLQREAFDVRRSELERRESELIDAVATELEKIASDCRNPPAKLEKYLQANQQYDIDDHVELRQLPSSDGVSKATAALRDRLETTEEVTADSLLNDLCHEGGVVSKGLNKLLAVPVQETLKEKREDAAEKRLRKERYDQLKNILLGSGSEFANAMGVLDTPDQIFVYDEPGDTYRYVKRVKPNEPGKILGSDDIGDANLWNAKSELTTIQNSLQNFVRDNVASSEYSGLNNTVIKYDGDYYDGHVFRSICMSRMFAEVPEQQNDLLNEDNRIHGLKEIYEKSFYIGNGKYGEHKHGIGAPWTVTLTTFIGGVFLDNIAPATNSRRGFGHQYRNRREHDLGEDIVIHHTHGIDGSDDMNLGADGAYVYRDRFINLNTDDRAILLGTEREVIEEIRENFQERVPLDCAVQPNESTSDTS